MTTCTMIITRMLIATLGVNSKRSLLILIFILDEMWVNASAYPDIYGNNNRAGSDKRISSRIVTTKYGALRGYVRTLPNPNLHPIEIFMGVPYASPPVGKLRFMPPVTPAHWNGVKSAHQPGPVCPQNLPDIRNESQLTEGRMNNLKRLLPLLQNQSEDCLYLNIFAPASGLFVVTKNSTRLPVIMFIHGESYEWNAGSSYDGSVLSSFANLVVVTINYRLGVLGFLPALEGTSRGNFGLMDQVAALHWIQENIIAFGGDANNVTIMGQGYGAACVNLLMLSPMAKGFFHRAIMQSGSALSPWAMATDARRYAKYLSSKLGCPEDKSKNSVRVDCLRQKSVKEIMEVKFNVPTHLTSFGPTVDGIVIPNEPLTLMADSNSNFGTYDLLLGVTKVESYNHFTSFDEKHGIDASRRDRILRTLIRNLFTYHLQEIYLTIGNEYTDWSRSSLHPSTIFDTLLDAVGDATVVAPLIRAALFHSRRKPKTFMYTFLYGSEEGDFPSKLGCVHGEDLLYTFGAPLVSGTQLGPFAKDFNRQEAGLSETVISYWSNFAKQGDPNQLTTPTEADKLDPKSKARDRNEKLIWPEYEEQQQQYLSINMKPKVKDHYHAHRLSYWVNLIPRLHIPGPPAPNHHLLIDHNALSTYDGVVRDMSVKTSSLYLSKHLTSQVTSTELSNSDPYSTEHFLNGTTDSASAGATSAAAAASSDDNFHQQQSALDAKLSNIVGVVGQSSSNSNNNQYHNNNNNFGGSGGNTSMSHNLQLINYSTALSVTIAIGCSLLILNVLVFAGVFYQRDKERSKNEAAVVAAAASLSRTIFQGQNNIDEVNLTKASNLRHSQVMLDSYVDSEKPVGSEISISGNSPSPITVHQWISQQHSISPSLGAYSNSNHPNNAQKLMMSTLGSGVGGMSRVSLSNQGFNSNMLPLPTVKEPVKLNSLDMMNTSNFLEEHSKSISSEI